MEGLFKPPEALQLEGNISENWRKFNQKIDYFFTATGLNAKPEERKVAVFLNLIGDDGLELYNTFKWDENEQVTLEKVKQKFVEYCSPKKNVIFERFVFNSIVQKEGQSFDAFVTEIRKAVRTTEYVNQDEMVRDRIVMGIYNKSTQEKLLREATLTLEKAVNMCRAIEVSKDQSKILQNEANISEIRSSYNSRRSNQKNQQNCRFCGYTHQKKNCPAWGKTCAKCHERNHFANVCEKSEKKVSTHQGVSGKNDKKYLKKKVYEVQKSYNQEEKSESESETESEYEIYVSSVDKKHNPREYRQETMWTKEVVVNGKPVMFKLDTGAEVSTLPLEILEKVAPNCPVHKSKVSLVSYGDSNFKIKSAGEVYLNCSIKDMQEEVSFIVLDIKNQLPLLGLQECLKLKLIKRIDSVGKLNFKSLDDVVQKYSSVFEGLGKFPTQHHITLKENVRPHISAIRRVPQILYEPLKKKLCDLELNGIIKKVDEPTEWVHPLVIVEKPNGDLRLCLDPKELNQAVKREHFLIPSVDEIAGKLSNKKYFTVLDMKDGYWQIELDKESSDLMTFGTPFGRYKFTRLAFGICSAPEVFQKKNFEVFGDLLGVGLYFDDLIVTGSTEAEHDQNLKLVLERALKYNIKFNKKKIQFKQKSVKFVGQIFSENGVQTNRQYINAILDMPVPQSKADVLRFLGMVKYIGKFIPNLSKITAPLRNLTRLDVEWNWSTEHLNSVNNLKHLMTNSPVLTYFDSKKPIEIETDASKDGLGACLLQDGKPVAFASRSLTKTEQAYAQIEKETLAILFAVKKFHYFVYGMPVKVHSDHKPLETIFKKDLQSISPRILRMRLKLLKYKLNICYKPGKYMYISDTLSRAFLKQDLKKFNAGIDFAVHAVIKSLPMSEERKTQFRQETLLDPQLSTVVNFINNGWPSQKYKIPENVRSYSRLKEKLYVADNLLFLDYKLIVPFKLRKEMLCLLHEGHLGIEKTKAQARKIFYWPAITADIENFIKACVVCEKFAKKNPKQTLLSYPLPNRPWERIGSDIFTYGNQSYVVLFDAYSNWLELLKIKDKSADAVITQITPIFSRFGSPDVLVADNIPYNSEKFKRFAKNWNFTLSFRSPNYPRSNGLAEKAVSISKQLLKKASEGRIVDLDTALMNYRNYPLKHMDYSPSQLLNSRMCKTKVPISSNLLLPSLCSNVQEKMQTKRVLNEKSFNKNAKVLKPLKEGSNVTVFNHKTNNWDSGKIEKYHDSPRSYILKDSHGNSIRRNRYDIRSSVNPFKVTEDVLNLDEDIPSGSSVIPPTFLVKNIEPHSPVPSQPININQELDLNVNNNSAKISRSGRAIKKPVKLDL